MVAIITLDRRISVWNSILYENAYCGSMRYYNFRDFSSLEVFSTLPMDFSPHRIHLILHKWMIYHASPLLIDTNST